MRCYACDATLIPDIRPGSAPVLINGEPNYDIGFDDHYQFDNALWVTLGGGYGMFVEYEGFGGPSRVVICHDCAHEACEKLPWLNRLIDPWASHSHKTSWVEKHPDHWGWDFSRNEREYRPTEQTDRPAEHEIPTVQLNLNSETD